MNYAQRFDKYCILFGIVFTISLMTYATLSHKNIEEKPREFGIETRCIENMKFVVNVWGQPQQVIGLNGGGVPCNLK